MMKTNMLKPVREDTQRKKLKKLKRLTRMIVSISLDMKTLKNSRSTLFGVAKTEALLVLRGTGKNKVKHEIKGKTPHNPSCWSRTQNCGTVQAHGLDVHAKWCNRSRGVVESGSQPGSVLCECGAFFWCSDVQPEVQEERDCYAPGDTPHLQQ